MAKATRDIDKRIKTCGTHKINIMSTQKKKDYKTKDYVDGNSTIWLRRHSKTSS